MLNTDSVLAIIPARYGSKRLPQKNIREFHGRPLVCWTIDVAKESEYIDTTVLSSDSVDILNIGEIEGVDTILRPKELASDKAMPIDVIRHVLNKYKLFDIVVWLQPTSPLRAANDIDKILKLMMNEGYNSIVSVDEDGNHNGAVYAMRINHIEDIIDCNKCVKYYMPDKRSVDIDLLEDFLEAERLFREVL